MEEEEEEDGCEAPPVVGKNAKVGNNV